MITFLFFLIFLFSTLSNENEGETWVVIVGGAKYFNNYAAQSTALAYYQLLHNISGIDNDHIILWHPDDIAHAYQNKYPGHVYFPDSPSKGGVDVYPGVLRDMTGKDVNVKNFMKMMKGMNLDKGSKKTLKSGGHHHVLFPNLFDLLYAKDLMELFEYMHENKLYKEMVFYLESCHSGSMFNGLIKSEWNIYALAASNPGSVAWECQCSDNDNDDSFCYAGCFGQYMIEDSTGSLKNKTFGSRTFQEQFNDTSRRAEREKHQTICQYGDIEVARSTLSDFQGPSELMKRFFPKMKSTDKFLSALKHNWGDKSRMKEKKYGTYRYLEGRADKSEKDKDNFNNYIQYIKKTDEVWNEFAEIFGINYEIETGNCYPKNVPDVNCSKQMSEAVMKICGPWDEYSVEYSIYLYRACQNNISVDLVKEVLEKLC